MSGEFAGRVVLVTGGARGLGRAISRAFVAVGAHVIVNYFHARDEAPRVRDELAALGPVELLHASVADRAQVDAMFDSVAERHGGLDVLVNNAAAGALLPMGDLDESHWRRALDTNLRGSLWCAQRAAGLMAGRPDPAIVNLSSLGSSFVISDYVTVGTSKAAVEALTRYLAVEFAPAGIRVNTASGGLLDGTVATMFPGARELVGQVRAATPLGHRLGREEELAALVRFLASPAASWITGQTVVADGGLSLGAHMLSPPSREPVTVPGPAMTGEPEPDGEAIAIVAMGVVTPGANDPDELGHVLDGEENVFTEPVQYDIGSFHSADPDTEDKTYTRRSGFVTRFVPHPRLAAELRDGTVPSREATTLWLRHSILTALDTTGIRDDDRCLAAFGYTADGSQQLEERLVLAGCLARLGALPPAAIDAARARYDRLGGSAAEYLPHRVGRNAVRGLLPAGTELVMVDTACSSALYSVDLGIKALRDGVADVAVCGGAFAYSARNLVLFSKLHGLSRSGEVRSFDRDANGVLFSDGAGVVVLKRLDRARADGDRVLGVVDGIGLSCDGRGKAIYAPNAAGQEIALRRAYAHGTDPASVDWVIAHATGTRAGDSTELESLHRVAGEGPPALLSSNKPIVGHTGWTAGLVSLVQALRGLRDGRVSAQRYLRAPIPALDGSRFAPPREHAALPGGRPRRVGVSAFGFGGTNAHLVLADEPAGGRRGEQASGEREPVVLVGWAADLPGMDDREEVARWLRGDGPPPAAGFGADYPMPAFAEVRLPPATLRNMDRTQIMLLRAFARLGEQIRDTCATLRETTGVVAGHMGPTRRAVHYALRCYLDDVRTCLGEHVAAGQFDVLATAVRSLVPPSTEDAFPGIMPNIIPARLAAQAGYNGLNVTVDTGPDAALDAVRTAERYLRHHDLDVAVVAGINGNSTGELAEVLAEPRELAEGAFVAVLARESTAREHRLPVLAEIRTGYGAGDQATVPDAAAPLAGASRTYLGADPMVALLARVADIVAGGAGGWVGTTGDTGTRVAVTRADRHVPPVERVTCRLLPAPPPPPVRAPVPPIPDRSVVLVAAPGLLGEVEVPRTARIVVAQEAAEGAVLPDVAALAKLLPDPGEPIEHVRVVATLAAGATSPADLSVAARLRPLHDLAHLAAARWTRPGTSFVVLLADAVRDGVPHPATGMFTGLVKSLAREEPEATCFAVVTDVAGVADALPLLGAESGHAPEFSVSVHSAGERFEYALVEGDDGGPAASGALPLGPDSVVVAAGGTRGLTSELLAAVADGTRPAVYLLGRQPPGEHGDPVPRIEFLAAARRRTPERAVADLAADYDRYRAGAAVRRTLDRLTALCGPGRVHHVVCDLTDEGSVRAAVDRVHADHGTVDLLINAGGVHRGGTVRATPLSAARRVRDTKVLGYLNLRAAFAGREPRRWHNFGSLLAVLGWPGEADYCAGNDLLHAAAAWQHRFGPPGERTVAWALWDRTGFAAEPLTRDLLRRRGELTGLSDRDGVACYLAELGRTEGDPVVTFLGEPERRLLGTRRPTAFLAPRQAKEGVEWRPDPHRDGYLRHHLLNGTPTLPGAFVVELAVQATGLRGPVTVREVRFHFPVTGRRAHHLHTTGTARGESGPVAVRVCSDLIAQDGTVFREDQLHAEASVAPGHAVVPPVPSNAVPGARPVVPRCYSPGGRIALSGPFAALDRVRVGPGGGTARFAPELGEWTAAFAAMTTPALLVDAVLQLVLLATAGGDGIAVPVAIDRIDVCTADNDVALLARHGDGIHLLADTAGGSGVATAEDGRVLVRVLGARSSGDRRENRYETEMEQR